MKRQVVGVVAVGLLAAACSSSSTPTAPVPKPTPKPTLSAGVVTVVDAYGSTINRALPQVTALSSKLHHCTTVTAACAHDVTTAANLAHGLLQRLNSDDELRQTMTSGELLPGVSPVVILSEGDARSIRRMAGAITTQSSKADLSRLTGKLDTLAAELNRWKLVTVPTS
jgi:hypothetical protein